MTQLTHHRTLGDIVAGTLALAGFALVLLAILAGVVFLLWAAWRPLGMLAAALTVLAIVVVALGRMSRSPS